MLSWSTASYAAVMVGVFSSFWSFSKLKSTILCVFTRWTLSTYIVAGIGDPIGFYVRIGDRSSSIEVCILFFIVLFWYFSSSHRELNGGNFKAGTNGRCRESERRSGLPYACPSGTGPSAQPAGPAARPAARPRCRSPAGRPGRLNRAPPGGEAAAAAACGAAPRSSRPGEPGQPQGCWAGGKGQ